MYFTAAIIFASFSPYLAVVGMENESVVINVFDRTLQKKTIYTDKLNFYQHPKDKWSMSVGVKNEVFRYSFSAVTNRKDKVIYLQKVVDVALSDRDATTIAKCDFQIVKMNYEGKILGSYSFSTRETEFLVLSAIKSGILGLYGDEIIDQRSKTPTKLIVQKLESIRQYREFSLVQKALAEKLSPRDKIVSRFDQSVTPCPEIADASYPAGEWLNLYTERCSDRLRKADAVYGNGQIVARWGSKQLSLKWPFSLNHVRMLDYPTIVGKFGLKTLTEVQTKYQIGMYPLRNESEIRIMNLKDGSFKSLGHGITPIPL